MRGRRTLLVVLVFGALVFGSVNLFATSAFTTTELTREVNVSVTTDASGLLALRDGHPDAGFVEDTGDGRLTIDFTRGGSAGANPNATFDLGSTADPVGDHAFRVVNGGNIARDVRLQYTLAAGSAAAGGDRALVIRGYRDTDGDGTVDSQATLSENTGDSQATLGPVAPDGTVYVVVSVDTSGLDSGADLSGRLNVTAGDW